MKILLVFQSSQTFFSYPYHTHKNWELICSYKGSGQAIVNGQSYPFQEGTILLIPPGIPHRKIAKDGYRDTCVQFTDFRPKSMEPVICEDGPDKALSHLFEIIYLSYLKKEDHHMEVMEHILYSIYLLLLDRQHPGMKYHDSVEKFENVLIRSFSDSGFNMKDAIKETGFSTNYFRTLFSEYTGMTPLDYLEWLRIEHAKEQLRQNGSVLSIGEISAACGFQDPYYFSRVFKKREGLSPREFLKGCQTQADILTDIPEEDLDTARFLSHSSNWHEIVQD